MKNNKKGLTLVEILVAMGLMTLFVAVVTPLMLMSLKSVKLAGEQRTELREQQTQVEKSLANGITLPSDLLDEATVSFQQGAVQSSTAVVEGQYITSDNDRMQIFGFLAQDVAQMSVTPAEISENISANAVFDIYCDLVPFEQSGTWALYDKSGAQVAADFTWKAASPNNVTMKVGSSGLSYAKGPYTVKYNGGEKTATIKVRIANIIAVGDSNQYFVRRYSLDAGGNETNVQWVTDSTQKVYSNNLSLKDIVWTGSQYVAAGDNGAWVYSSAETSNWNYHALQGKVYFLFITYTVNGYTRDLALAPMSGELLYAGYGRRTFDYHMYGSLPNGETYKATAENLDWGYASGYATVGAYENNVEKNYEAYYDSNARSSYVQVNGTSDTKLTTAVLNAGAWNQQENADSEVVFVSSAGEAFSERAGGDFTNNSNSPESGRVVDSTKPVKTTYTFSIVDKDGVRYSLPVEDLQDLPPVRVSGTNNSNRKYYVTIGDTEYQLYSNSNAVTKTVRTYYTEGSVQMSGALNGVAYGADKWVAAGKNVTIARKDTSYAEDVNTPYTYNRSSQTWSAGSTTATKIDEEDNGSGTSSSCIVYRDGSATGAGKWKTVTNLPTGITKDTVINKVEYVGGRFYALGNGFILSSTDGLNWQKEAISGTALNFTGLAGSGQ